ncbi:MAG: glycosyltransferase family 2 protein [Patescibacteria group bacterium]
MKVCIVVPAYNEEQMIGSVLRNLKHTYSPDNIIVVNDCSTDQTGTIAHAESVVVVSHVLNRGLGGALGTGIAKAIHMGADIVVTFDSDGQHLVEDIERVVEPIKSGKADVVIGSRLLTKGGMPLIRRAYNRIGNIITYLLFGMMVTDSQSGLRALSNEAARSLDLKANRMEVSSEIIREIKVHNFKYEEIPIKAIYSDYSLSKGQSFFVGVKTFIKLIVLRITK